MIFLNTLEPKGAFELTSNWFRKWFSRKWDVWLLLQIRSNWKAFPVDQKWEPKQRKIISVSIFTSNDFRPWKIEERERERERERKKRSRHHRHRAVRRHHRHRADRVKHWSRLRLREAPTAISYKQWSQESSVPPSFHKEKRAILMWEPKMCRHAWQLLGMLGSKWGGFSSMWDS